MHNSMLPAFLETLVLIELYVDFRTRGTRESRSLALHYLSVTRQVHTLLLYFVYVFVKASLQNSNTYRIYSLH